MNKTKANQTLKRIGHKTGLPLSSSLAIQTYNS